MFNDNEYRLKQEILCFVSMSVTSFTKFALSENINNFTNVFRVSSARKYKILENNFSCCRIFFRLQNHTVFFCTFAPVTDLN